MLTADERDRIQARARAAVDRATLRKDPWWTFPLSVGSFLIVMIAYSTWAGFQTANHYAEPYLSPIFSPCLAVNCEHATFRLIGSWWIVSPAIIVFWLPISFRITCYYYRKAYYRAFFLAPPACAVAEPWRRYSGETRFPHVIVQNLHRYFLYLMVVNLGFLWWDTILAFSFPDGFGVGVGTLLMVFMIVTMTFYIASCHSARHAVGGNLDRFSQAPLRYRAWRLVSRLNERHGVWALASLFSIPLADIYVRLVATGTITDLRLL